MLIIQNDSNFNLPVEIGDVYNINNPLLFLHILRIPILPVPETKLSEGFQTIATLKFPDDTEILIHSSFDVITTNLWIEIPNLVDLYITYPGWHTVTVTLQDPTTQETLASQMFHINVLPVPIKLEAIIKTDGIIQESGSEITREVSVPIEFNAAESKGEILLYQWNVGDGSDTQDVIPTHAFQNSDNFLTQLKITDPNYNIDTSVLHVNITETGEVEEDWKQYLPYAIAGFIVTAIGLAIWKSWK